MYEFLRKEFEMTPERKAEVEKAAKVGHEVNKSYCESIGDHSQPSWDAAPMWQRESCIAGVLGVLADPDTTPEESHERWRKHKEQEGWTYYTSKNVGTKQHPCMVPWNELPEDQRKKSALFTEVVKAFFNIAPPSQDAVELLKDIDL
jgi:hypothetical protein